MLENLLNVLFDALRVIENLNTIIGSRIMVSYLTNIPQYITVKGAISSSEMSQSGFLSDLSNLGPFFFTVVINIFPKNLHVGCVLNVDYTSLYAGQNDLIELQATMEEAQADAVNWLPSNKLH